MENKTIETGNILATIYSTSEFMGSIQKTECKLSKIGFQKYAQYDSVPFAEYTPKGKRTAYIKRSTSYTWLLILQGHGHPQPADMFGKAVTSESGMTIRQSTYQSFDDRYKTDFDNTIREHLKTAKILLDVRHTEGTNILNAPTNDPQPLTTREQRKQIRLDKAAARYAKRMQSGKPCARYY